MSINPCAACWIPSTIMKQFGETARIAFEIAATSTPIPVTGDVWRIVATRMSSETCAL